MSRTRRTAAAVVSRYVGLAVAAIVGFVSVPLVLRYVSRADYGLWIALGEAIGYLVVLDFGTGSAITRMVARLGPEPDGEELSVLFSTALFISSGFALVYLAAGATLMAFLPYWHAIPSDRVALATSMLALMLIRGAITFPIRIAANTLVGMQRQFFLNICSIAGTIAGPVTYLLLFRAGWGAIALAVGALVTTAVSSVPAFVVLKMVAPSIRVSWRKVQWDRAKALFNWSFFLFVNGLAVLLIYYTDNLVIASNLELSAVSLYTLTGRLVTYWFPLLVALPDSTLPALVDLYKVGAHERFREVYLWLLRVMMACSVGIAVVACSVNREFVTVWVGVQNFGGVAMTVILALTFIDRVYRQVSSLVVVSTGRIQGIAYLSIVEAGLNLVLSLTLVRYLGVLGVALGTLLAEYLTGTWYAPKIVAEELKISLWAVWGAPLLRPATAAACAACFGWVIQWPTQNAGWGLLAIHAVAIGICYVGVLALLEWRTNNFRDWEVSVGPWLPAFARGRSVEAR